MTRTLKVSVAMATWNGAAYLEEQLASIVNQSYIPDEIVVVDDGSCDDSFEIAQRILSSYCGKVILKKNKFNMGYGASFLLAYSMCSGDVIFFSDQDDVWRHEKINTVMAVFEKDVNALVVLHDFSVITQEGKEVIPSYYDEILLAGKSSLYSIKGCTMAVRRAPLKPIVNSIDKTLWKHDVLFAAIGLATRNIRIVNSSLINHRIHSSNTSGRLSKRKTILIRLLFRLNRLSMGKGCDLRSFVARLDSRTLPNALSLGRALANNGWKTEEFIVAATKRGRLISQLEILRKKPMVFRIIAGAHYLVIGDFRYNYGFIGFLRFIGLGRFFQ